MHLRINVRVDADQNLDGLVKFLSSSPDVVQVKLAVYVDQHPMLNSQFKLPWKLPIAIENSPTFAKLCCFQHFCVFACWPTQSETSVSDMHAHTPVCVKACSDC